MMSDVDKSDADTVSFDDFIEMCGPKMVGRDTREEVRCSNMVVLGRSTCGDGTPLRNTFFINTNMISNTVNTTSYSTLAMLFADHEGLHLVR